MRRQTEWETINDQMIEFGMDLSSLVVRKRFCQYVISIVESAISHLVAVLISSARGFSFSIELERGGLC